MINKLPVLPDWCASVLVFFGIMAVLVYVMQRVIERKIKNDKEEML